MGVISTWFIYKTWEEFITRSINNSYNLYLIYKVSKYVFYWFNESTNISTNTYSTTPFTHSKICNRYTTLVYTLKTTHLPHIYSLVIYPLTHRHYTSLLYILTTYTNYTRSLHTLTIHPYSTSSIHTLTTHHHYTFSLHIFTTYTQYTLTTHTNYNKSLHTLITHTHYTY